LIETFLQACEEEDPEKLTQLLKEDIILYSDGGGKAAAAMHPLLGAPSIIKFVLGIARKRKDEALTYHPVWINNSPAILFKIGEKNDTLVSFDIEGRQIRHLYIIRNPDKISLQ
jgi:RNA polymerase sigma-70 factor (ECF subfamily)